MKVQTKYVDEYENEIKNYDKPEVIRISRKMLLDDRSTYNSKETSKRTMNQSLRWIIEEVYGLTPEEYDNLYSTSFNRGAGLEHSIKCITTNCPLTIKKECLFSNKKIVLRTCWPEYFKEKYQKPTAFDILDANSEIRGDLKRVSKIVIDNLENEDESKDKVRYGLVVDEIIYNAINEAWPKLFRSTTEEMFYALANPKKTSLDKLGAIKIIMARGCYPSPLDFYMWNSPVEFQKEHLEEYLGVREDSKLPVVPEIELITYAYYKEQERLRGMSR